MDSRYTYMELIDEFYEVYGDDNPIFKQEMVDHIQQRREGVIREIHISRGDDESLSHHLNNLRQFETNMLLSNSALVVQRLNEMVNLLFDYHFNEPRKNCYVEPINEFDMGSLIERFVHEKYRIFEIETKGCLLQFVLCAQFDLEKDIHSYNGLADPTMELHAVFGEAPFHKNVLAYYGHHSTHDGPLQA